MNERVRESTGVREGRESGYRKGRRNYSGGRGREVRLGREQTRKGSLRRVEYTDEGVKKGRR